MGCRWDLSLGLEKATNARDLGGYRTVDGRTVRTGRLFRANALNRLSEADVAAVGKLGLSCVIDFRHRRARSSWSAPDRLPPGAAAGAAAVFDPDHDVFTAVSAVLRGLAGEDALVHLREDAQTGGAARMMIQLYRCFVRRRRPAVFAAAARLVADAGELPLLFHCTAGKDRTGWLAAILLSALGVSRETVITDYLRTDRIQRDRPRLHDHHDLGAVRNPRSSCPCWRRGWSISRPRSPRRTRFGGMEGYLRHGLELDEPCWPPCEPTSSTDPTDPSYRPATNVVLHAIRARGMRVERRSTRAGAAAGRSPWRGGGGGSAAGRGG